MEELIKIIAAVIATAVLTGAAVGLGSRLLRALEERREK